MKVSLLTPSAFGIHPRWMVVDDEQDLSALVGEVLTGLNLASVENFTSPEEALHTFATQPGGYDLVVTDLDMPKLDGLSLARAMQRLQPGLQVILVSANADRLSREEMQDSGIVATLCKPFSLTHLEATVRAVSAPQCFAGSNPNPLPNACAA